DLLGDRTQEHGDVGARPRHGACGRFLARHSGRIDGRHLRLREDLLPQASTCTAATIRTRLPDAASGRHVLDAPGNPSRAVGAALRPAYRAVTSPTSDAAPRARGSMDEQSSDVDRTARWMCSARRILAYGGL